MKSINFLIAAFAFLLFWRCQPPNEDPQLVNLTGRWIGMGYQCPIGTYHNETVDINHDGSQISAIKVTGDPCVPAGSETFTGSFDEATGRGVITLRTGNPSSPSCCSSGGTLTLEGCTIKLNANTSEEIILTRVDKSNAVDYDVPNAVPLIPQPNTQTCWAASATMMWSWRDNEVLSISYALCVRYLFTVDYCSEFQNSNDDVGGLSQDEANGLFSQMGLTEVQFSPSINGIKSLLEGHGPLLLINGNAASTHARVLTGIHGDGTSECTYLNIIDPWEPNVGRVYVQSYKDFISDLETLVGSTSLIPIHHW